MTTQIRPQFGQIIHLTSDRNNSDAVAQLFPNLGNTPDQLALSVAKGVKPEDVKAGISPESFIFTNEDSSKALRDAYNIASPVSAPFLKDHDLTKLYLSAQFDPGSAAFFKDVNNYIQSQGNTNPVREKLFAYAQKQRTDSSGLPILNIVV